MSTGWNDLNLSPYSSSSPARQSIRWRHSGEPYRDSFFETLGDFIINENVYGENGVLAGAILVALLAVTLELALAGVQRLLTSPGLKSRPA
ncbi:MAG: hypothetical protein QOE75_841 [Solirubrobacterales bacterium]|nr:hypothetical protein [Solirubrobacterales bacterium]